MASSQRSDASSAWKLDQPTFTQPVDSDLFAIDSEMHHSIVKVESRFKDKKTGHSIWKTGNGWLIRQNLVVTAADVVYDAEYQLGAATQVKCYVGRRGRTCSDSSRPQLFYGRRITTSADWMAASNGGSQDVAFIHVAEPQIMEACSCNTFEDVKRNISAAPREVDTILPVPETEENPMHCLGCAGTCGSSATATVKQSGSDTKFEPDSQVEDPTVTNPTTESSPTESNVDGFVSISTTENTAMASMVDDIVESDPFYKALTTVSEIDTQSLEIESSLIGSVGQFVSIVGGSLLRNVAGAKSVTVGDFTKLSGAAESALLAEASLQAVLAIQESPELDEILEAMKENWTVNAPKLDEASELLYPHLVDSISDITTYYETDQAGQTGPSKKHQRRALGIRHFPGSGLNGSGTDFAKGLFAPTLVVPGREDVFPSVGPVLKRGVLVEEKLVSPSAKAALAERISDLLQTVAKRTESASVSVGLDIEATRILLQRAILADAALQALSSLPKKKLELLDLVPLDSTTDGVENIFDFLKTVLQKIGPIALLPAKNAIKDFAATLVDPSTKVQQECHTVKNANIKTSSKLVLRDRLRTGRTTVRVGGFLRLCLTNIRLTNTS
ncbi:hypothetical protein S7711_01612 [Stachybotrys chartarum IBT 7711]|uniref:Peptidase S1 domain-containing protein n=1 Tax=Stachybotrys chartarum (strain CBS 109288 / IBT 7711) TaxID=1280523 RepID=A0A084BC86_STACB|nr:hypothetical protein S7711_01612 [Stachybotrys chartarum IBT 7711]